MSCGVGHRGGSDLALLWLWCRPAAVAPMPPLAWEFPYAMGAALKKKKKKKKLFSSHSLCYPIRGANFFTSHSHGSHRDLNQSVNPVALRQYQIFAVIPNCGSKYLQSTYCGPGSVLIKLIIITTLRSTLSIR